MPAHRVLDEEEELRLIRDFTERGIRASTLRIKYGVSQSTVYRVLADHQAPRRIIDKNRQGPRLPMRRELHPRVLMPCGTEAAYRRHIRKNEIPCQSCRDAHAEQHRIERAQKKER